MDGKIVVLRYDLGGELTEGKIFRLEDGFDLKRDPMVRIVNREGYGCPLNSTNLKYPNSEPR